MTERAVAETLGAHVALSSSTAVLWWKVAHGKLSADDAAAQVLAGGTAVDDQAREEVERAKLVFAPVTQARQDQLLEDLLTRRRADEVVVPLPERAAPKDRRTGKRWVVGLVVIAVAVAAALALWWQPGKQAAFVGKYTLELSGMTSDMRGKATPKQDEQQSPRFWIGGRIDVELTPLDEVAGPLEVVGFAQGPAGEVQPLSLEPVVYPSGKAVIDMPVRALGLHEGTWELVLAVGRAGEVPRSWDELGAGGPGYEVVRETVQIVPKPVTARH